MVGAVCTALKQELQALLAGDNLGSRVEHHGEVDVRPGDASLIPLEQARIALGDFNLQDKTHLAVYESFSSGQELPMTWQETLDLHIKLRNRRDLRL